ncbi:MAG TPA: uroporphyrinogen-III C-methyltransferase [Tahibacter sp.]|nr:uroporphyrinogen-III C-methyltransferase [Tahibacter sp.]
MDMDTPDSATPALPPSEPAAAATATVSNPPRSRLAPIALIAALAAAGIGGLAWWQASSLDRSSTAAAQEAQLLRTDLDGLRRNTDLDRRDRDQLRQRLTDAENVNKSLREELLGVTERARVLEDAIANLADKRLSGHDSLLLNEAELVLLLAKERFELFRDSAAAERAYRLADTALAAVEDPAFATVRETLAVELRELAELKQAPQGGGIAELERLRQSLPSLDTTQSAGAPTQSRLARVLGQFVRVSHTGEAGVAARDPVLLRGLIGLDLRAAELALLERNDTALHEALARARAQIAGAFDANAANVQHALATLDRLGAAAPPPAAVELGATLKELRNLRSTHTLSTGAPRDGAEP